MFQPHPPPRPPAPAGRRLVTAAAALFLAAACAERGHRTPVPASPAAPALSAPASATAGQAGYLASVPPQAGARFAWTVDNGTLASPADGPDIRFTAGADLARPVTVTCAVTGPGGIARAEARIPVHPGPLIEAPAVSVLGQGTDTAATPEVPGTTYRWSISGGQILAGQGSPRITFFNGDGPVAALLPRQPAAAGGGLTLSLEATDAQGQPTTTTLVIPEQVDVDDPPAGLVYSPARAVVAAGQDLPLLVNDSTGGSIGSYRIDPPLPDGLVLDPATGFISGRPTAAAVTRDYRVTATGATLPATTTAVVTLTVTGAPAGFGYTPSSVAGQRGVAIPPLVPSFTGGDPATGFSVDPALPAGLALGADGTLSGTPSVTAPAAVYTVTARNGSGSATTTVTLAVAESAPAGFSYPASPVTGRYGVALALAPVFAGGGPATTFSISPALPPGLVLGSDGSISGVPAATAPATPYTITASNDAGSASTTLTLAVVESAPAGFSYPASPVTGHYGVALSIAPSVSSGGPASGFTYRIGPAAPGGPGLPAGLAFDPVTGVLSGTPSATLPAASYAVTVSNGAGSASTTVTLAVAESAPAGFSYPASPVTGHFGATLAVTPAFAGGGPATGFSISPALPPGLALGSDGSISGVPAATAPATPYTVTASNGAGSASTTLTLAVAESAPAGLSYPANPVTGHYGVALSIAPSVSSGGPGSGYSFTLAPAVQGGPGLPAGLGFDTRTGIISGTPTATLAATNYTVTVSNGAGSTSTTLTLAVAESAPAGLSYPASPVTGHFGVALSIAPSVSSGGPGSGYTYSLTPAVQGGPGLPAGLGFDTGTGILSGTPTATLATTSFTVTASNGAGSASTTLTLAVAESAPAGLSYPASPVTGHYGVALSIAPSVSSGGPGSSYTYSLAPAVQGGPGLPAGLSFDTGTGVLSGTPTAVLAATSFTVTVSNGAGSASTTLTLAVAESAPAGLSYPASPVTGHYGVALSIAPSVSSGGPASGYTYSLAPAVQGGPGLPAGLSFDTGAGILSGTPTATLAATSFTVTVSNGAGSTSATLTLAVAESAPAGLSYSPASAATTVGSALGSLVPAVAGGGPASGFTYSLAPVQGGPALPAGLAFDSATGILSGTPTAALPGPGYQADFTATVGNAAGSTTATVTLTITYPPVSVSVSPAALDLLAGRWGTLAASAAGAPPFTYQWTLGGTAAGTGSSLTLPAVSAANAGTYTVTVTDGLNRQASASATVAVHAARSRFAYLGHGDGSLSCYTIEGNARQLVPRGYVTTAAIPSLLAIAPDNRRLYSADQAGQTVSAFNLDAVTGLPVPAGSPAALPGRPVQVQADPSGSRLYVAWQSRSGATVTGGSITVYPIAADGTLGPGTDQPAAALSGGNAPAALAADPTGNNLLMTDLTGRILELAIGTDGTLTQPGVARTVPNGSPLVAVNPANGYAYVIYGPQATGSWTLDIFPFDRIGTNQNAILTVDLGSDGAPSTAWFDEAGTQLFVLKVANASETLLDRYPVAADGSLATLGTYRLNLAGSLFLTDADGYMTFAIDPASYVEEIQMDQGSPGMALATFTSLRPGATAAVLATGSAPPTHQPGFAYVGNAGAGTLSGYAVTPGTGALVPLAGSPMAGLTAPGNLVLDPAGAFLYQAGTQDGRVACYAVGIDGSLAAIGSPAATGLASIGGLAMDPSGLSLLVLGLNGSGGSELRTFLIDRSTGWTGTLLATDPLAAGGGGRLGMDPLGRFVYVLAGNQVQPYQWSSPHASVYGPAIDLLAGLAPAQAAVLQATGLAVLPDGFTLLASLGDASGGGQDQVAHLFYDLQVGQVYVDSYVAAGVGAAGVAADPMGVFAYVPCAGFVPPGGSAVPAAAGSVYGWFVDAINGTLDTLTPAVPLTGLAAGPSSLTVDPSGRFLYLVNGGAGTLTVYPRDPASGAVTAAGAATVAAGADPGTLVITDRLQ